MNQTLNQESKVAKQLIIDVRTPSEFSEVHIPDSVNVPLADVKKYAEELKTMAQGRTIMLLCRTGRRAEIAQCTLSDCGIVDAAIMEGGMVRVLEQGDSVVRGKKGMSIERQVRVAAGFLVLLGVILGSFLHPAFLVLSGFVGAGLIFAGLTDTCGMAMALGLLPFNRVSGSGTLPTSCSLKRD